MGHFISFIQYCQHQTLNVRTLLFPNPETVLKYQNSKVKDKDTSKWCILSSHFTYLGCPPFSSHTPTFTTLLLLAKRRTPSCSESGAEHQLRGDFWGNKPNAKSTNHTSLTRHFLNLGLFSSCFQRLPAWVALQPRVPVSAWAQAPHKQPKKYW